MATTPYLSEIAEMVRYRAQRARINGHSRLAEQLDGFAAAMETAVESGGDGQTNGQTEG